MNIVFLTLGYPKDPHEKNLYTDLMKSFASKGHTVTVFHQNETEKGCNLQIVDNVKVVDVYTGAVTKTSFIKKGINLLLLKRRFIKALRKENRDNIDLLLYSTPPITFAGVLKEIKKHYNCCNYLLLKDIFPQNALDLGIINKNSLIYKYFKSQEKVLYKYSDYIGCMSPANVEYVLDNYKYIDSKKVHVSPNCIIPYEKSLYSGKTDTGKLEIVYGGNLGKPQGIDFLIECIELIEKYNKVKLSIIGSGTEYGKLEEYINAHNIKNTILLKYMPKDEYLCYLQKQDAGLILLDRNFTIPNFPSRVLDYMNLGLPVIACTDKVSDVKQEICEAGAGLWCESGDIVTFESIIKKLLDDKKILNDMSLRSRDILYEKYDAQVESQKIIDRIIKGNK